MAEVYPLHEEIQPRETKTPRVGGSLVGCIVGCDSFGGDQLSAYLRLRGYRDDQPTSRMLWGIRMEPLILEEYARVTGREVIHCKERLAHPLHPFMAASFDAVCKHEARGIDAKLVMRDQAYHWGETANEIPLQYQLQAAWYMAASDFPVWDIAALIDFELRIYEIRRDLEVEEALLRRIEDWWMRHIVNDELPEVGLSAASQLWLRQRFPANVAPIRRATAEEIELLEEYAITRNCEKEILRDKAKIETALRVAVGDSDGIFYEHGRFTWKRTKDSRETNWEALANFLMLAVNEEDQKELVAKYTTPKPGYRRTHFASDRLEKE